MTRLRAARALLRVRTAIGWRRLHSAGIPSVSSVSNMPSPLPTPSSQQFAIGFDRRDLPRLHALWDRGDRVRALGGGNAHRGVRVRVGRVERPALRGFRQLVGGCARGPRVCRGTRRDRPVPVEHVHGDTARSRRGRRARRVRRREPRRPLRLVCGLRREGGAAPAPGGVRRPHRRPHRVRDRADRGVLHEPRASSWSRTVHTPTARRGTAGGQEPGATSASGRSPPRRRSRPERAECSSRAATTSSPTRGRTGTTASRPMQCPA